MDVLLEGFFAEFFSVLADDFGVIIWFGDEEAGEAVNETLGGRVVKKFSGATSEDGFGETATTVGKDWFSAGHGFDGGDAKVFFSGEDEGAAVFEVDFDFGIGFASEEVNGGSGEVFEVFGFGSVADDD